jgi:hypothetical protein
MKTYIVCVRCARAVQTTDVDNHYHSCFKKEEQLTVVYARQFNMPNDLVVPRGLR